MISCGMMFRLIHIYVGSGKPLFKYKLLISAMTHFLFGVNTMLLKRHLPVVTVVVGVFKLPRKSRRLPPTVKRVLCVSCLCGFMSHTILPKVNFSCQTGPLSDLRKNMYVRLTCPPTPCASCPSSFAKYFPILLCQLLLMRCTYSWTLPVIRYTTKFEYWFVICLGIGPLGLGL